MADDKKTTLARLYEASLNRKASGGRTTAQQNLEYIKSLQPSQAAVKKTEQKKPKTFIEGLLNVLEGPMQGMYAATGAKSLANPEYARKFVKDPVGTSLGQIGEGLIPGRFLAETVQSWFNPEYEKVYGSDIIEGTADTFNTVRGQDTFNEKDNVNPWVKGIGGFALDVAVDPLTYIPGGILAKPFTKGAQVARTALGLPAKGVSKITGKAQKDVAIPAAAAAEEAVQTATRAVDDAVTPAKAAEEVSQAVDTPEIRDLVDEATKVGASNEEVSKAIINGAEDAKKAVPEVVPERIPTLGEKFAPEFKKTKSFLARFSKELAKSKSAADNVNALNKVVDLSKTTVVLDDGRRVGALDPAQWVEELGRNFRSGGINYHPQTIAKYIREKTFEANVPRLLRQEIVRGFRAFKAQYDANYQKGVILTIDGDTIPIETIAAAKAATPKEMSALELFRRKMDTDTKFTNAARAALGTGITTEIGGKMSRKRFDELLRDIGDFVDGGDLDTLRELGDVTPRTQEFLLSKGITNEDIQANYSRLRAELAGVDEDMVAKAGAENVSNVRKVLQDAGITPDEMINEIDDSFVTQTTGKKTKRTSKKAGEGLGRQRHQINQYVQTTLLTKIIKSIGVPTKGPVVRKSGGVSASRELYGAERIKAMRDETFARLDTVENALDEAGIPEFMFYGDDLVPMRMGQAMKILSAEGGAIADRLMFNGGTLIPPTNLAEAIAYIGSRGADDVLDEDVLRSILQNTETYKGKGQIPNALSPTYNPNEARIVSHYIQKPSGGIPKGHRLVKNEHASKGWYRVVDAETLTDEAIAVLQKARPALQQAANAAKARYAERLSVESSVLYQDEIDHIMDLFNTGGIGSALKGIDEMNTRVAGKAQAIGAMNTSSKTAQKLVEGSIDEPIMEQAERVVPAAEKSVKAEKKMALASPKQKVEAATDPLREASQKMAKDELDKYLPDEAMPKVDPEDPPRLDINSIPDMVAASYQSSMFKKLYYTLTKNFNARSGIESGWEMQHGASGIMAHINLEFNRMMQDFARNFRTPLTSNPNVRVADEAMRLVQRGVDPEDVATRADGPILVQAMEEAQKIWDLIFTTDKASTGLLGSDYFKSGGGVELINSALARFGAGSKTNRLGTTLELAEEKNILQFNPDLADEAAALSGRPIYDELVDQVKDWDLGERPLDTLRTIQASFSQALMHANVSDQLQAYAVKNGLYSKTPVKGWYQPAASKRAVVLTKMDPNGYYPIEFLEEVGLLDNFLQQSRSLDGPFGEFINKTLDPVLDAWKFGMTIIRPGHHFRNAIGDASITYAAEGVRNSRVASVDATRLLAFKNSRDSKYEIMDYLAMLNRLEPRATANAGDVLATISLKNGTKQKMTIGDTRRIMEEKGLFPSFGVSEDLLGEGTGAFAKAAKAISLQTRLTEKVGGGISQYRDHWARAQHFMQFIRNNASKYSTVDDLYEAAAKQVKRYHPDGSMLTAFEAKYMRRGIPFYSWMRGILPGAIEATIKHPGRFMVAPKASYNLAVAMGIDPESLSNPFPEDQLFPSFIREDALGPQFLLGEDYIRMNPGVATLDILGTFGPGIGQGIISSLNPMFKLPFEINNMTRLDTGAKIHDVSDYIDSQIPNIGPISNITGLSPSSLLENLLTKGTWQIDPQYQVEKGNKGDLERGLSFTNWLSGLQTQNLSQPNLINYAEIEMRNEAAKQAKEEGK